MLVIFLMSSKNFLYNVATNIFCYFLRYVSSWAFVFLLCNVLFLTYVTCDVDAALPLEHTIHLLGT